MENEVESHCLRQGGVNGSAHLLLREPVAGANVDAVSGSASPHRCRTPAGSDGPPCSLREHRAGVTRNARPRPRPGHLRARDLRPLHRGHESDRVPRQLSAGIDAILEENVHGSDCREPLLGGAVRGLRRAPEVFFSASVLEQGLEVGVAAEVRVRVAESSCVVTSDDTTVTALGICAAPRVGSIPGLSEQHRVRIVCRE